MAKGRKSKKGNRKGPGGLKRRFIRRAGSKNTVEYASMSEARTMSAPGPAPFNTKTLYSLMDTSLSQFTRAQQVAQAYQHYRIKYIQLKIRSSFDTYAVNPTTPIGKPYLYYLLDKSGTVPTNISLEGLKMSGAKPRALDEKTLLIGWKPTVLEVSMTAGGPALSAQGAKYVTSPWLNTNANSVNPGAWTPSTVDHLGVYFYVDQQIGVAQPYTVEVEVQFEFKKSFIANAVSQVHALPVVPRQLNQSKDGVVDVSPGGDDEELHT